MKSHLPGQLTGILFLLFVLSPVVSQQVGVSVGEQGMVSSAHPIATNAGVSILQKGGNAFDAAVAIAATLNVVEPMNSGMGGYGTILVYDAKSKRVRYLDSSGKIPSSVNSDVFRAPTPDFQSNRVGPKSVSTPGNVNAWDAMSSEYGRLDWAELFSPAIRVAEEGFDVSKRLEERIGNAYQTFPDYAKAFYGVDGRPLKQGEPLVQKDLAKSLKLVAERGPDAFYRGDLAKAIDREMNARGSFLSIEDLEADKAEWWEPISIEHRGYRVFTASPPATAFPSLIRLGMMGELFEKKFKHNDADYLHHFAEVTKHAFWCRLKYAGDPELTPPPLEKLLSRDYLKMQVAKIDSDQATEFQPPGVDTPNSQNTTHFVVADRWGNIVSATQTLGNEFGSRIMPVGTGIWFNNSLAYCTFEPKGNPMDAKPGQRKLSGDCPTIIFQNGKPWAAIGTPGGHTIGQTVPQMVINLVDFEMDIAEAIAAPRVSFIEPNWIYLENEIDNEVVEELKRRGHKTRRAGRLGNAHGLRVWVDENGRPTRYEGASDPRGEGSAKGY